FYLFFDKTYFFILSALFVGFGYAVTSGNLEALIHDNLDELGKGHDYDKIQSNQSVFMYLGRASSSFFAGYLYFYSATLPYIATIICFIIATILVFFIHSPKQELSKETNNIAHMKKAFIFLSKNLKMLMIIMFVGFILSGIGNIYWFTYQPYLEKIGVDISNIGIIYFFVSLFSAIGSYFIKMIKIKYDTFEIIKYMLFMLFFISLMFHYIGNIFGVIPILTLSVGFGFITFLGNTYLIKQSPKTHKSTILSIFSLSVSLGYFIFGSVSGYIAQIYSLDFLYTLLPFVISGMLFLYIYLVGKKA
ncbi:MAG: MFS transporter, partial [Candidatus Gracilibacteria bacterium]|nr:MFS transporter [Candidatus Gracilibacteria bacterium]